MTSSEIARSSQGARHNVPAERALVASPVAHALSAGLAAITIAATIPTAFVDGILNGLPAMNGSARGTAIGMLLLGVPLLIGSQIATRRGSAAAVPLWLAASGFLLYNAVMLLFGTPFNGLFLMYVATLSLALWCVVVILRAVDLAGFERHIKPGGPIRTIAVIAWIIAALNTVAWLRQIIPGMMDAADPAFLVGSGLTTAPTYVQDLAFWLPLMAVAAYWLWHRRAEGYLVVTAVLTMWVIESLTIALDQYLGALADPSSPAVSAAMTPVFLVVAGVTAVPTALLIWRIKRSPVSVDVDRDSA